MNYVGIDIHKRYSVCASQDEQGRGSIQQRARWHGGNSTTRRRMTCWTTWPIWSPKWAAKWWWCRPKRCPRPAGLRSIVIDVDGLGWSRRSVIGLPPEGDCA